MTSLVLTVARHIVRFVTPGAFISLVLLAISVQWLPMVEAQQSSIDKRENSLNASWDHTLAGLRSEHEYLAQSLSVIHRDLREAVKGRPRLSELLKLAVHPQFRPGYGVVPEIVNKVNAVPQQIRRTVYSLDWLRAEQSKLRDRVTEYSKHLASISESELEYQVNSYLRYREKHHLLAHHLTYHAYWQQAVRHYGDYFASRNALLPLLQKMQQAQSARNQTTRFLALQKQFVELAAKFQRVPTLSIVAETNGIHRLPIEIWTDIDNEKFLRSFRRSAESMFNDSPAAKQQRFELSVRFHRVSKFSLYPSGSAPKTGAAIDVAAHRSRFPPEALVLTTGAQSTHAWVGSAVLLGPEPISARSLVHEFGHLLGFGDGYLRTFEGAVNDPGGVNIIEWTGITNDLMGSDQGGRVTAEMIRKLLLEYGPNT